ncbi:MAG: hypothetical protein ABJB66_04295 [Gemmatimonadaceae bacterium]
MRSLKDLLLLVAISSVVSTARAEAQPQAISKTAAATDVEKSQARMEEWVTKPSPIKLTTAQRKSFDAIKIKWGVDFTTYVAESRASTDKMKNVKNFGQLTFTFHDLVRDLLTPEQQPDFEANFEIANRRRAPGSNL